MGWLLVTAVASALIFVGSLLWFGNCRAVIPDFERTTSVQLELIDDVEGNEGGDLEIQAADHDRANPLKSQMIVRGSGDQDDNRERPFVFRRVDSEILAITWRPAVTAFADRRTAVAYWNLGRLKVMPAGDAFYTAQNKKLTSFKASRIAL